MSNHAGLKLSLAQKIWGKQLDVGSIVKVPTDFAILNGFPPGWYDIGGMSWTYKVVPDGPEDPNLTLVRALEEYHNKKSHA